MELQPFWFLLGEGFEAVLMLALVVFAVLMLVRWSRRRDVERSGNAASPGDLTGEEAEIADQLRAQMVRMEQRMENLETILDEDPRKPATHR